jgi:hypothetical protein
MRLCPCMGSHVRIAHPNLLVHEHTCTQTTCMHTQAHTNTQSLNHHRLIGRQLSFHTVRTMEL